MGGEVIVGSRWPFEYALPGRRAVSPGPVREAASIGFATASHFAGAEELPAIRPLQVPCAWYRGTVCCAPRTGARPPVWPYDIGIL